MSEINTHKRQPVEKGNTIHPQIVLVQGLDICQYTNWQISVLLDHEQHRTALKNFFPFQFSNCHNPALQALRGQRNQMPGHPMVSPGLPNMYAGNSSPSALRFVGLARILIKNEMWPFSPFSSNNTSQHWNGSNPIHIKQEIQIPQVRLRGRRTTWKLTENFAGLLPHLLARQLPKSRHDGRQSGCYPDLDFILIFIFFSILIIINNSSLFSQWCRINSWYPGCPHNKCRDRCE